MRELFCGRFVNRPYDVALNFFVGNDLCVVPFFALKPVIP